MTTTNDDGRGLLVGLSRAQALEVAKRLSPPPGRLLWFGSDGTLLTPETVAAVAWQRGEVYACRRERGVVQVARVRDARPGAEPDFGATW